MGLIQLAEFDFSHESKTSTIQLSFPQNVTIIQLRCYLWNKYSQIVVLATTPSPYSVYNSCILQKGFYNAISVFTISCVRMCLILCLYIYSASWMDKIHTKICFVSIELAELHSSHIYFMNCVLLFAYNNFYAYSASWINNPLLLCI